MIKVSVVILNWNGADMLRRFLPSVISCSQGEGIEVCVADNGSSDDSCRIVEGEFPSVRLIRLPENYGFADGYNKALEQVDAEYVVLLNSDVEVSSGWLSAMVSYMDLHPEVAACQPKILDWKNKEYFEYAGAAGGFIDRYGYPFCRGRVFDTVEKDIAQYDELVCLPQSVVYHVGGATLKKENPRKTFLNFRNNLLMLYKNLPAEELVSVMRTRTCLDYLAALFFLLKGDVSNFRAVLQARKEFLRLRPEFVSDRQENLDKTVLADIPERFKFSILWQSKLLGRKKYADLPVK